MENMKRSMARGASWNALSAVASAGLQVAQIFVLARLLGPGDFGLMAMAMVVTSFMQTVVELGIGNALIYRQNATADQINSLFALNLGAGVLGFAVALTLSPACARFFDEPLLRQILPWCAAIFLIAPFGQLQLALLQRHLRFKAISAAEITSQLAGFALAVILAARGYGVFALIWSLLLTVALRTLLLNRLGTSLWPFRLHFRLEDMRGFIGFGFFQTASGILNFVIARIDSLVLGRLLGAVPLGYYNFAYSLVMQPITRINPILMRVAFPVFARFQADTDRLRRGFFLVTRILLTINAPLMFGLAAVMRETIGVVFDAKWQPSVLVVEILAMVALFRSAANPVGYLVLARGRADLEFRWNLLVVTLQIAAVWIGAREGGMVGVAIGLLTVQFLLFGLLYGWLVRPMTGPCLPAYLRNIAAPLWPAGCMGALLFLLPADLFGMSRGLYLACEILVGAVLYAGLLVLTQRDFVREMVAMFVRRDASPAQS